VNPLSSLKSQRKLVLTHDVDWPFKGPGKTHVLARQDRFAPEIIEKVKNEDFNPYFGVAKIREDEEKIGVRSTFFFRPIYDDGSEVDEYTQTIRDLNEHGWEVGLHANNTSTQEDVKKEKSLIEKALGKPICGCRVHYLKLYENSYFNLASAGIKYDSSLSFDKQNVDPKNTGYLSRNGITIFPITFMDAYLFTYMGLTEETVVPFIVKTTETLYASGVQLITLLWHDNSVMMKGGRAYPQLIEQLAAKGYITFLTGSEAFNQVQETDQK
jgi:peptidoglycan/xylan/chitin deacetylase (PgdA/CDA1 family)